MDEWEETTEDNVYSDEGRENKVADGEISPEEAAFMQGYDEADKFDSMSFDDEDDEDKDKEKKDEDEI